VTGTIPGGIISDSGLILSITFQAKTQGDTQVSIRDDSQVLLNDGFGSPTVVESNRGTYAIVPKPAGEVRVFSDTHPFQDHWYNNNSPVVAWDADPGVTGFSYILDNNPNTIPESVVTATDTEKAYQDLKDGIWYFHIKAFKKGGWGTTTSYMLHIDTTPPASFVPSVGYLTSSSAAKSLVTFFTTDALSGIDHYEVGVIDKTAAGTASPIFIQTESPYQMPFQSGKDSKVLIRAFDAAGNTREESVDVSAFHPVSKFFTDNAVTLLIGCLALLLFYFLFHYLFGHHIIRHAKRIFSLLKREEQIEKKEEERKEEYLKNIEADPLSMPVSPNDINHSFGSGETH